MTRQDLLQSLATTIADYRQGEISAPDCAHVDRWIRQFDAAVQEPMLAEMDHVLKQSYLSREYFLSFLRGVARMSRLAGFPGYWQTLRTVLSRLVGSAIPRKHATRAYPVLWRDVQLLEIQKHGASQQERVRLLKEVLSQEHGPKPFYCRGAKGPVLYLDDVLFTGNRIIADLVEWIRTDAPEGADLVVIVIAFYRRGFWYSHKKILRAAADARKTIRIHWLRATEFQDRRRAAVRDGFHPTRVPDLPLAHAYAWQLGEAGFPPGLRLAGSGDQSRLFSSEAGRHFEPQAVYSSLASFGVPVACVFNHLDVRRRLLFFTC
jgi:hypothetical protein